MLEAKIGVPFDFVKQIPLPFFWFFYAVSECIFSMIYSLT